MKYALKCINLQSDGVSIQEIDRYKKLEEAEMKKKELENTDSDIDKRFYVIEEL